jgi:hypothetical protein
MDDEEMLFKQVKMTAGATKGTTVWICERCSPSPTPTPTTSNQFNTTRQPLVLSRADRNTVYGYPW